VHTIRAVGRDAAARKYDILTALSVMALAKDKHQQRQVLRLIALITARYNWQTNTLSVGQTEIARLWSVDLRTVKREMARFRAIGWLFERQPAARGRVAVHGIDLACILADTKADWPLVGPDFVGRMAAEAPAADFPAGKVVPFPLSVPIQHAADETCWHLVSNEFQRISPAVHAAWVAPLVSGGAEAGHLVLHAPSRFHADYVATHLREPLVTLLRRLDPHLRDLRVVAKS
jgi:hypothetical protein